MVLVTPAFLCLHLRNTQYAVSMSPKISMVDVFSAVLLFWLTEKFAPTLLLILSSARSAAMRLFEG
jgi:hypothetical protein